MTDTRIRRYKGYGDSGETSEELYAQFTLSGAAKDLNAFAHRQGIYLKLSGGCGRIRAPIYSGELKHFFSDVKNYYYLPAEDCAVHKSVSSFVDKSHRVRATKDNCYVRKEGLFIPVLADRWGRAEDGLSLPLLQKDAKDRLRFVEYKEEDMEAYVLHVLKNLCPFERAGVT